MKINPMLENDLAILEQIEESNKRTAAIVDTVVKNIEDYLEELKKLAGILRK